MSRPDKTVMVEAKHIYTMSDFGCVGLRRQLQHKSKAPADYDQRN